MSRNTEYKFVPTDSTEIVAEMTAAYEKMTGRKLQPADPDKLFIAWISRRNYTRACKSKLCR